MNAYQKGLNDGIRQAKKLITKDIRYIYGILAIVLLEMNNTEDEVISLLGAIQDRWITVTQSGQSVKEYLSEHLPFEIYQDIV